MTDCLWKLSTYLEIGEGRIECFSNSCKQLLMSSVFRKTERRQSSILTGYAFFTNKSVISNKILLS